MEGESICFINFHQSRTFSIQKVIINKEGSNKKSTETQTDRKGINRDNAKDLQLLTDGPLSNYGACMGCACVFTHNPQVELLSEWQAGPMGWVQRDHTRVHTSAWGTHQHAHTFTSEHQSLPAKEEEGELAVMSLLEALHVGAVEGSALPTAVCVASHADILSLWVSLGYMFSLATGWTCKWESSSRVHRSGVETSRLQGSPGWAPATA